MTGYGVSNPGRLYQHALALRNGKLSAAERDSLFSPTSLGFYTTLVLEAGEQSLAEGGKIAEGVTCGTTVDLRRLVTEQLGTSAAREYRLA